MTKSKTLRTNIPEYIYRGYNLPAIDSQKCNLLCKLAKCGDLTRLKRLKKYNLSTQDLRAQDNRFFLFLSIFGRSEMIKYVHSVYDLTAEDVRAQDNAALIAAIIYGHVEIVRLLHELYKLAVKDIQSQNYLGPRAAVVCGHAEILKMLHDLYGLTADDLRKTGIFHRDPIYWTNTLDRVIEFGHLGIIEVLKETYGLTAKDDDDPELLLQKALSLIPGF